MKALSIKNLKKTYKNSFTALKGINFEVEQGDFFALLGANGAGKSTTIGIISSLINKTSGQVTVFGHDLDTQPREVKSCIGLVPQEFNCNIFEKCDLILKYQAGYYGLPKKLAAEKTEYYLARLGLWEKRNETSKSLSGGMKRRLMIARALVHEPKMLILDEPTAGVDIEIRHSMWEFLQELNQNGTTIILTTHYLEEAEKLCRNIAIIKQGEIALNSDMKAILAKTGCQTIQVELKSPLNKVPKFSSIKATPIDEMKLEVTLDSASSLNIVFEEFNQHNIEVHHIQNEKNRLENLFLDLIKDE